MADSFTSKTGKIFAWVLIVLITLSFGVWGIGDIFKGGRSSYVAKVGKLNVSYEEYRQGIQAESRKLQSMMGGQAIPDAAKREISNQVLMSLIREKLLKQEIKSLNLEIADKDILKIIAANPGFADEKGNFSGAKFKEYLERAGKSEQAYIDYLKHEAGIFILMQSIAGDNRPLGGKLENIYKQSQEKRDVIIAYIPINKAGMAAPADQELQSFYESHKQEFSEEEKRDVSYLLIDPAKIKRPEITEDDVKAAYEKRKDEFLEPETRDIGNLIVKDEAAAKKIAGDLKAGGDFSKISGGGIKANILKNVKQENMPQEIAGLAFKLSKGQVSDPIKSPFGWHIIKVLDIKDSHELSYDQVKQALKEDMAAANASLGANKFIQTVDDEAASGAKIDEVAKKYNLETKKVTGITKSGKSELPEELLQTAFSLQQGAVSGAVQMKDGKFAILYEDSVYPLRIKAFDEVRGLVEEAWKKSKAFEAAEKEAADFAGKFKGETKGDFASAASAAGYSVKTINGIKSDTKELPPQLAGDIFSKKIGASTMPYPEDGRLAVAYVKNIEAYEGKPEDAALAKLKTQLAEENSDDLVNQYFAYLGSKYPVKVNQELLETK